MNTKVQEKKEFILLADAHSERRKTLGAHFADLAYPILYARDGEEVLSFLKTYPVILIILSQDLLQTKATHLSRLIQKVNYYDIILFGDGSNPINANELIGQQVRDYLPVLSDPDELRMIVLRHLRRLQISRENHIIGNSPKIQELLDLVIQIANTNSTVLITGESGTGKELIARAIHQNSPRRNSPFIGVNVGALPETLLESELFGHEKGSFTGAVAKRIGHFELANHGTLFLDEIGEMSLSTQVKLLRVLEERTFMRVGGHQQIKVDVRVIAATNRDLVSAINEKIFRQDLYYRLKVVSIHAPTLRQRQEDIPLLVNAFIEEFKHEHQTDFKGFAEDAFRAIKNYSWPGNIRELRNFIESMVVLYPDRLVTFSDLPDMFKKREDENFLPVHSGRSRDEIERELIYKSLMALRENINDLQTTTDNIWLAIKEATARYQPEVSIIEVGQTLDQIEEKMIRATLKENQGNRRETARVLGISERTLYRKMERYGID